MRRTEGRPVTRTWRALVLAAALVLGATGCGDKTPKPAAALPTASASPSASAGPAAGAFQAALDRLIIDRALARTDRAEAAAEFNREGSDRPSAMAGVKAACARLLAVHQDFDTAMRAISFPDPAKTDADAVFGASGTLIGVLARYAEATATEQFASLNRDEQVANAVWEQTVGALAQTLGVRGLAAQPGATPTGAPTTIPGELPPTSAPPTAFPTEPAAPTPAPSP